MAVQIVNYGACIRLVTDGSVLMLAKSQVVNIEVIRDDTVRVNIGEGPLKEILIKLAEVSFPAGMPDVAALRDAITHMLDYSNQFEVEALLKQQLQIDELIAIKQLFTLWHSSLLTDLNFQQLQVNGLTAINNRLLESKEGNEQLLNNQQVQTTELRNLVTATTTSNSMLGLLKTLNESLLTQSGEQTGDLRLHTGYFAAINNTLLLLKELNDTFISNQQAQTGKLTDQVITLGTILTGINSIKSIAETQVARQNSQIDLLTASKSLLADIKQALNQNP